MSSLFVLVNLFIINKHFRLLVDPAEGIQEQAFNIVRNLAEDEEAIDMVFEGLGTHILLERLVKTLESRDEDVVLQVCLF